MSDTAYGFRDNKTKVEVPTEDNYCYRKSLWYNSRPLEEFAAQTITLASAAEFDYIEIHYTYDSTNNLQKYVERFTISHTYGTGKKYLLEKNGIIEGTSVTSVPLYQRAFTPNSSTSISFGDCYTHQGGATSVTNKKMIPAWIYGIKMMNKNA